MVSRVRGAGISMSLELKNISKSYKSKIGKIKVLDNVNLHIKNGEFVCILGSSGGGKTTLLNIIAGFEEKTSGEMFFNDREIKGIDTNRVVMFQEAALFPWLKVIDNVEFGMKMKGIKKSERRAIALEYLEMVNLVKFQNSYIHELSGGMRQRVALARALAMDSQLLLMDEPFSALDEETRKNLHIELLKIWEQSGKTIIFVTHNIEEAIALADTIYIVTSDFRGIKKKITISENRTERMNDKIIVRILNEVRESLTSEVKIYAEN